MHPFMALAVPLGAVGIHWFGQSSYALKDAAGTIVQVDPYFPRQRSPERFVHAESPLDETTLRTDYVLLTHNHLDHTWPESLLCIAEAFSHCRFYGPVESVEKLRGHGIAAERLVTVAAGDVVMVGTMAVHAVWAKAPQGAPGDGIPAPDVTHLGYVIEIGGVTVYVSGDLFHTFAEHDELLEPIAALRPDLGLLTTHPSEGEFPFFDGSVKMAMKLGLLTAAPAHYSCFVKRNYDPQMWAASFPAHGPELLIIPYNRPVVYRKG